MGKSAHRQFFVVFKRVLRFFLPLDNLIYVDKLFWYFTEVTYTLCCWMCVYIYNVINTTAINQPSWNAITLYFIYLIPLSNLSVKRTGKKERSHQFFSSFFSDPYSINIFCSLTLTIGHTISTCAKVWKTHLVNTVNELKSFWWCYFLCNNLYIQHRRYYKCHSPKKWKHWANTNRI